MDKHQEKYLWNNWDSTLSFFNDFPGGNKDNSDNNLGVFNAR